jgi:hypothetical protein
MNPLGLILILGFVVASFWGAATRPRFALLAMVFLAPWGGLYADFGLWINAYQIVLLALLICTLGRSLTPGWQPNKVAGLSFFLAFLLFAVLDSLVQLARLPDPALNVSALRGPTARAVIQMFMFTFTISPAILVAWRLRSPADIAAVARTYITSAVVLAIVGWGQLLVWYGTGNNPMPIGVINAALGGHVELSEGIVNFGKLPVFRMNSLAGEPRTLGGAMVFAMMMIQAIAATANTVSRRKLMGVWLFLAASTLATLSTTALLVWIIGSVVQFPAARLFGVRLRISGARIAAMLLAVALPFGIATAALEASGFPIIDLIAARTIERIDSNGAVEDFDLAIIDFLKDNPGSAIAGTGVGNAHLYAQRYIDPEFQYYALGNVFTAKTQYLRLISEVGLIGFGLFLLWYLMLLIETSLAIRRLPLFTAILPIATMAIVVFLATGQIAAETYILMGCMAATCAVARRPKLPV